MLIPQKAKHVLSRIQSIVGSLVREGILPLCSGETPSVLLGPILTSLAQEKHGPVGLSPEHSQNYNYSEEEMLRIGVQPREEMVPGRPNCDL